MSARGTRLLGRNSCTVQFPAASTTADCGCGALAGTDADLATMTLGNHNNSGGSGSAATGTLSLNGYPVDIRLGTLTLGEDSNGTGSGTTSSETGTGVISFDTGTVFATGILMAITTKATNTCVASGTINVGANATLIVGSGGLSLANLYAGSLSASGALNINGGTVVCSNSITKASTGGTGTITLSSGRLNMVSGVDRHAGGPD